MAEESLFVDDDFRLSVEERTVYLLAHGVEFPTFDLVPKGPFAGQFTQDTPGGSTTAADDFRLSVEERTVYLLAHGVEFPTFDLVPKGPFACQFTQDPPDGSTTVGRRAPTSSSSSSAPPSPSPAPPAPTAPPAPPQLPPLRPSQRPMDARDIDDDRDVTQRRPQNSRIYLHSMLSTAEKNQLFIIAKHICMCTNPPLLFTVGDWERFLGHIFDGWNSAQSAPRDEKIPNRKFAHTHIPVGFLRDTLPFSDAQKRSKTQHQKPERVAGATVYFGLSLNLEAGCIQWRWRDSTDSALSSKYVKLKDGYTHASIRAEAVANYDSHEFQRVQQHNQKHVIGCARRAIKKWAQRDQNQPPMIDDTEFPNDIVPAVFATPMMKSEIERWTAISNLADPNFPGLNVAVR
ncbi:hypothetical protein FGRMN_7257 [Fusarium graminum]|nr:hypothetical protein FGRMN_7257 [Fusarium graminum]